MDSKRVVEFIESSFLGELLKDENVTDISYNGNDIFYMNNTKGRSISDIHISSSDVKNFIRQIANLTEKQFSFQTPILDVTAGEYRLNAVHNSIARFKEEQAITFSLRIASSTPRITDDSDFLTPELISLMKSLIKSHIPIIIGGVTGSGKTEFQKYLLSLMESSTRVIVIDNVLELSQTSRNDDVDINVWQADERNISTSIQLLVKNALRSNPDWLVIAESRGGEMLEILNSVMTGHPAITTIHASDVDSMPRRVARMVMMNDKRSDYLDVVQDVYDNFPIYIYLKRKINKSKEVVRFIESIAVIDKSKIHKIYEFKKGKHLYYRLPNGMLTLFEENDDNLFIKTFGGRNNESF